jgi:transcriptional regulator with XRE-family HTH domain
MENTVMNLPEAIRHARKDLGLSQAALAHLCGVQRRQISVLERGGNVTMNTVRRVLRHLPNLHRFTLDTATVGVNPAPSEPWRQGVRATAAFIARVCQHVIDRAAAPQEIE